jgi:hypothetical protein
MFKKLLPLLMLGCLMAGCVNTSVSRLTPPHELKSQDGYYLLEAQLDSTERALRWDQPITATAIVGPAPGVAYPMKRTTFMTNRWETLVPIPAGQSSLTYRFKFEYYCNTFGAPPQPNSTVSKTYKTDVVGQQ